MEFSMIKIQNMNFAYRKKNKLFNGLELHLTPGNIYGLLGKNGAGKTTLLKILTGLLFPQSGEVSVMNYEPRQRAPQLLSEIYLVPEEFYVPPVTIAEYRSGYAPFYPRFDGELFGHLLTEFELPAQDKLATFSFGQKKKFLLAFGLATNTKVLLLDEPTNGLDIPSKSQFRRILAGAINEERLFIISTHQVRDMANLIDPLVILDEGRIIYHQTLENTGRHLTVNVYQNEQDLAQALFYEQTIGGYAALEANRNSSEGKIDIELLFNAVINNRQLIENIFGKEA